MYNIYASAFMVTECSRTMVNVLRKVLLSSQREHTGKLYCHMSVFDYRLL